MKIKDITRHMNDHGTRPRIKVFEHKNDYARLIYEGSPYEVSEELEAKKVNSFTVWGPGYMEINV